MLFFTDSEWAPRLDVFLSVKYSVRTYYEIIFHATHGYNSGIIVLHAFASAAGVVAVENLNAETF